MVRAYLIRHGKSAAGFDAAIDPPLSDLGHEQARIAASRLSQSLCKCPILSSPMLRAVQTAQPLAVRWQTTIDVEPALTEIPVPDYLDGDLKGRRPWLDAILKSAYGEQDPRIETWRRHLLTFVAGLQSDCVIFTHYLTINAIAGAAAGSQKTVICDPGYCGQTEIEIDPATGALRLVS